MTMNTLDTSAIPMSRIDGRKVRRLRESKGLTQLYVATAVGVTTDTVSRWENNRYPAIKKENALKLAEALEASIDEILEDDEAKQTTTEESGGEISPGPGDTFSTPGKKPLPIWLWLVPAVGIVLGLGLWWRSSVHVQPEVSAYRILPRHTSPGQSFPVLIHVETENGGPFALILNEMLPPQCVAERGEPPFTAVHGDGRSIKWISKTAEKRLTFAYIAKAEQQINQGALLHFDGKITLRKQRRNAAAIQGGDSLEITNYHWADANSDGIIDDEEILTVYDDFNAAQSVPVDQDLIEAIWSGSGYRWDKTSKQYVVIP